MYQFKKINEDEYILVSNDKEFPFKRTVDIAKEMQSIDMLTTIKVADFLAERGETYDNTSLRVERKEGNQTIIDESNLRKLEEKANTLATDEVINKIYKKLFGKGAIALAKEVGIDITNKKEVEKFSFDIAQVVTYGLDEDTPRNEDTQGNREGD